MRIAALIMVLCAVIQVSGPLLHAEDIPENSLMYTGIDDSQLEKEAASLGIPTGSTVRYVSGMKNLNQEYLDGSLTWAEYIMAKRNFIEDLK
ncbi:MAG: hypothetical protein ABH885_06690 [Candidatus Omnitrophota bacterium]